LKIFKKSKHPNPKLEPEVIKNIRKPTNMGVLFLPWYECG
jgi:hypothetical protein